MAFISLHFLLLVPLKLVCGYDVTGCILTYYCSTTGGGVNVYYICSVDDYYYAYCETVTSVIQPTLTCISQCWLIGWSLSLTFRWWSTIL